MKRLVPIFALGLFALCVCLLVSCQKLNTGNGTGNGDSTSGSPIVVLVQSQEDGTGSQVVPLQTCSVPAGSATGTVVNCTVSVPQGQLYNSSLLLTVSTASANDCDRVEFAPYYYQASNQAAFQPEWLTAPVDCTVTPLSVGCFSGPATSVVTGFPGVTVVSQSTQTALSQNFTIPSAATSSRLSNRWAANDLPATTSSPLRTENLLGSAAAKPVADDYLAGTFKDYTFTCRDAFGTALSSIVMTVTPEIDAGGTANVNDPTVNLYPSWLGTLAPQPLQALSLSPFQVVVQASEEANANLLTTFQTCAVAANVTAGGTGSAITCQAQIPQGQLFFSNLVLTMQAASEQTCYQMVIFPYYYISNNTNAAYQPPWLTAPVDCTARPLVNSCYGGPAPVVVTTFPTKTGTYQLTSTSTTMTTTIPSANSQNWVSNRWASNDLPAGQRGTNLFGAHAKNQNGTICNGTNCPIPEDYVANSFVDYKFYCNDKFDQQQYAITLTVSEIVSSNAGANVNDPTVNIRPDWLSTLAPQP